LYFNPEYVEQFKDGEILMLYGYTKETKSVEDTVHLSIPLGKVVKTEVYGEYELNRANFEREF
jgi:hypothetical protein